MIFILIKIKRNGNPKNDYIFKKVFLKYKLSLDDFLGFYLSIWG